MQRGGHWVIRALAASGSARAVAALVWVVAALGGCAVQKAREPVQFESEAWTFARKPGHKLTTAHYEIYTTLSDEVLVNALPDFVEAAFDNYRKLIPPAKEAEERMQVYLFATRGQWEAFTRRFTGPRAAVFLKVRNGGYSERGVSVIEYVAHQVTFPLFAHEGFHQYLHHYVNEQIPSWLNEGLAVYCEGQRWGTTQLNVFDPWYNPKRRNDLAEALIAKRLHPLSELLQTNAGRIIEGSDKSVGAYYAQVWALILFLQEGAGGKYAAGFQRLLGELGKADLVQYARAAHIWSESESFNFGEALFRNFVTDDVETAEREYVAFIGERFIGKD